MRLVPVHLLATCLAVAVSHVNFTSNCDHDHAEWNRHQVASAIQSWIDSIQLFPNVEISDMAVRFHDKEKQRLKLLGHLDRKGPSWMTLGMEFDNSFKNGFLYGVLDKEGEEMSGDNIAFIFPDMKTALVGRFKANTMIEAFATEVIANRCRRDLMEVEFAKPKDDSQPYWFEELGGLRFSGPATLIDPYERTTVYVKSVPGKGEGLFARRDIAKDEVISYYAGMAFNVTARPIFTTNQSWSEMMDIHKNLIVAADPNIMLNIPKAFWSLAKYRATLSHKCNHSFKRDNARFIYPYHPRYGVIRGLASTKAIAKGQEILVDYGYDIKSKKLPRWYYDAYQEEVGGLPEVAQANMNSFHLH